MAEINGPSLLGPVAVAAPFAVVLMMKLVMVAKVWLLYMKGNPGISGKVAKFLSPFIEDIRYVIDVRKTRVFRKELEETRKHGS